MQNVVIFPDRTEGAGFLLLFVHLLVFYYSLLVLPTNCNSW